MASIRDLFITIGVQADTKAIKEIDSSLRMVGNTAKWAGIAIAGSLAALGGYAIKQAADFEQTEAAFTTMLGSSEKAKSLLTELEDIASKTSFSFSSILEESKSLLGRGFTGAELPELMRQLSDVAGGLGKDKLPFIAKALADVRAKGKLLAQESNQFANSGLDIMGEIAGMTGKSKVEIIKMREAGLLTEKMVMNAFSAMTKEGGRFYQMAMKQNLTFWGQLSNIQDVAESLARTFGKTLVKALYPIVFKFREWLEINKKIISLRLEEWANRFARGIQWVGDNFERLVTFAKWFAMFVGTMVLVKTLNNILTFVSLLNKAFIKLGITTLLSMGQFLLYGAILAGILFIINDIYHTVAGHKSLLNEWAKDIPVIQEMVSLLRELGDILAGISRLTTGGGGGQLADAIAKGQQSNLEWLGIQDTALGKWFNDSWKSISSAIGLTDNAPVAGTSPWNKTSNVTKQYNIEVNAGSGTPQDIAEQIAKEVEKHETMRNSEAIEDF